MSEVLIHLEVSMKCFISSNELLVEQPRKEKKRKEKLMVAGIQFSAFVQQISCGMSLTGLWNDIFHILKLTKLQYQAEY